jgi:hypothetical protein
LVTAIRIAHVRTHHCMCRWISIWMQLVSWHWWRWRKHIHWKVYIYTCVSWIGITWMLPIALSVYTCQIFRGWRSMVCLLLRNRRNRWDRRHIIRMVRPMIRHRIFIRFLMNFIFLFLCVCLVVFLVWRCFHIKVIIYWITIWIVVIRWETFGLLGIVFVVLSVLIVSSFVCLVVLFWSERLFFMRIVWGMHWHMRIMIRVCLHSWVYFWLGVVLPFVYRMFFNRHIVFEFRLLAIWIRLKLWKWKFSLFRLDFILLLFFST